MNKMEKKEDQARLGAFMRWQLLPFIIVVFVYAALENLWIYFQPGNQFVPPYLCLFIYNIILAISLIGLCFKKNKNFDILNLALTYFFLFAVEIFNSVRVKEPTGSDEYRIFDEVVTFSGFLKSIKINQIAGLVFFFYAVHVRSKCLEFLRGNLITILPLDGSSCNIVYGTHPSEDKISKSKIRWVIFIFVVLTVLKAGLEEFLIVDKANRFGSSAVVRLIFDDIVNIASTLIFYRYRSINFNILNILCPFSWFFSILYFGSHLRFWLTQSPNRLEAYSAIGYIIMVFIYGVVFVWANYTRLLLIEDCGFKASLRRPFIHIKFGETLVPSSNIDVDNQDERNKPQSYQII